MALAIILFAVLLFTGAVWGLMWLDGTPVGWTDFLWLFWFFALLAGVVFTYAVDVASP